ncbi:hypothetical protein MLD38_033061 [Melastoma candidum]|uniref:Uncharacterized protein n=1 Tax=Melastoma candidum TaxID=119954 RepID=A0ACB9M5K9_9MYRT|nr:hypothetical protein MLD38_033061 [Melastoma candidum]
MASSLTINTLPLASLLSPPSPSPRSPAGSIPCRSSFLLPASSATARRVRPRRSSSTPCAGGRDEPTSFVDEDGTVEDLDGYLKYLSPEYESVWDTKPSWCQPWTIALTGALAIACSWLIFRSILATTVVSFLIGSWWYIFLYAYPKEYSDMITERRKRIKSGVEDTFGWSKAESID